MAGLRRASTGALALFAALSGPLVAATPEPVDWSGTTVDGHAVRLADFRGRWLLVNHWATWCGACVAEMPALSRLGERVPRLAIVGLTDEVRDPARLQAFVAAHPVNYPVAAVDAKALPPALAPIAYGLGLRPISYLVSPDGVVVDRFIGEIDLPGLERRIADRDR